MLATVVISGEDIVCCLALWFVFSVMWLLKTSAISCSLWYECQRVVCAFTSPVKYEYGKFVMCCMQYCISVSAIL